MDMSQTDNKSLVENADTGGLSRWKRRNSESVSDYSDDGVNGGLGRSHVSLPNEPSLSPHGQDVVVWNGSQQEMHLRHSGLRSKTMLGSEIYRAKRVK